MRRARPVVVALVVLAACGGEKGDAAAESSCSRFQRLAQSMGLSVDKRHVVSEATLIGDTAATSSVGALRTAGARLASDARADRDLIVDLNDIAVACRALGR
jgi:hypothetical protein